MKIVYPVSGRGRLEKRRRRCIDHSDRASRHARKSATQPSSPQQLNPSDRKLTIAQSVAVVGPNAKTVIDIFFVATLSVSAAGKVEFSFLQPTDAVYKSMKALF